MQRKHVLAYLLFSLFLFFLLPSCLVHSSGDLFKLASGAKYEELSKKTAQMLAKRIEAEPLFYRSIALQQLHKDEEAFHVLNLYFGMAKIDDKHLTDAHRLMCSLSLKAARPDKGISSSRWLESKSLMGEREAGLYYQALLMTGDTEGAARVFVQYLEDTIEPYAFAKMLLLSGTERDKIATAFSRLSFQEQLTLLESIASDIISVEKANLLLHLATPLEQAFEGGVELGRVYRLLENLYGYADMRVQQRKYNTLAQNFR